MMAIWKFRGVFCSIAEGGSLDLPVRIQGARFVGAKRDYLSVWHRFAIRDFGCGGRTKKEGALPELATRPFVRPSGSVAAGRITQRRRPVLRIRPHQHLGR
jgi:hypothetical protein